MVPTCRGVLLLCACASGFAPPARVPHGSGSTKLEMAMDPMAVAGAVAVAGAAGYAIMQQQEVDSSGSVSSSVTSTPAPAPSFFSKKKAAKTEISVAAWSGDAFGAARWPAPPVEIKTRPAPVMVRAAWSGSPYASKVRADSRAQQVKDEAAARAAKKATLSALGISAAPPPVMERAAWSGSPYESPARAVPAKGSFFDAIFNMFKSSKTSAPAPPKAAPKAAAKAAASAKAPEAAEGPNAAWLAECSANGVVSFYDYGIKPSWYVPGPSSAAGKSAGATDKSNAEWRSECDTSGVVSFYDYGVRLA